MGLRIDVAATDGVRSSGRVGLGPTACRLPRGIDGASRPQAAFRGAVFWWRVGPTRTKGAGAEDRRIAECARAAAIRRAASSSEQTLSSSASSSSAASPSRTGVGSIGRAMTRQRNAEFGDSRARRSCCPYVARRCSKRRI
jgi:hypothetical protein